MLKWPVKLRLTRRQWIFGSALAAVLMIAGILLIIFLSAENQKDEIVKGKPAPFLGADSLWADQQLAAMSTKEKVGQLFMIDFSCFSREQEIRDPRELAAYVNPGSVCLVPGPLKPQLALLSLLRSHGKMPVMAAVNAETGLLCYGDTLPRNPWLPGIGAIGSDSAIARLAVAVAGELRSVGIQINLAPSLSDLNLNNDTTTDPAYLKFSADLSRKTLIYAENLQKKGILACAATFPNFRNQAGSSLTAPRDERGDSLKLNPWRQLVAAGLSCIMVKHSEVTPEAKETQITDSLNRVLDFSGLVIADFTASADHPDGAGVRELLSLKAGSDILRVSSNIAETYDFILQAAESGKLTEAELNARVRKILLARKWSGLDKSPEVFSDSTYRKLPWRQAELTFRKTLASSMVLLSNQKRQIPVGDISGRSACLVFSAKRKADFPAGLASYAEISHFLLNPLATEKEYQETTARLKPFQTLVVAVFSSAEMAAAWPRINDLIRQSGKDRRLIVVHFGAMEGLAQLDRFPLMIHVHGQDKVSQNYAAQAIYGGFPLAGSLPYTCSQNFCFDDGVIIRKTTRIHYGMPEEGGVKKEALSTIDSIVDAAIRGGAFPGCQVFVARRGTQILNRAYGHHTYDRRQEVSTGDLYDLASVTKVAAGTLAIMALYDAGKIDLDTTLNFYFKDLDKNSKGKKVRDSRLNYITLKQIMIHHSGLPSALPIARFISPKWYLKYMMELEAKRLEENQNDTLVAEEQSPEWMVDTSQLMMAEDSIFQWLFSKEADKDHKIQIGTDVYMRQAVIDSIWELAKMTAVRKNKTYVYSDMNFYLVMKVVESLTRGGFEKYLREKFFHPLKLGTMCFNPRKHFDEDRIVPTEEEKIFRKQLIHGFVHDPTAALLGGVSGNAGLFSNARDLGILMQMVLKGGTYGGRRYLSEKTVKLFTSVHEPGYRGLGWDHQTRSGQKMIAPSASPATYGHTGFTGTCVWVDPVNEIVFVFLSNRVHPKNTNQRINGMRVRQKVQQAVYDALTEEKNDE
jgi:beta-N-acetylhexosaminidase